MSYHNNVIKIIFIFLLLLSIFFPVTSFLVWMDTFGHNQYENRFERLEEIQPEINPDAHSGLTKIELSKLDEHIRSAYSNAVTDGHRLGRGYDKLWSQSLILSFLLFLSSVAGLIIISALKNNNNKPNA